MKTVIITLALILGQAGIVAAQTKQFKILLEPLDIKGLSGIQSFSYGQHDGKWLIVGGRLDGLHRRQPFDSFSESGNNKRLIVIDPVNLKTWSASLSSLSLELQDQLSATNLEFHQEGKYLYIIGGYGYSASRRNHTTYGNLTAIDVPNTIKAIMNGSSFENYFRQISDTSFAVTGGHLKKINETFYLTGGQKFIGRYNPMGPDHGPGFFQKYTDQVRMFSLSDDGIKISIKNYKPISDTLAFHRRDFNVVSQVLPDGTEGLILFSGVFQTIADIPFLNSVTINKDGYKINPKFAQYFNHYQCAVLPMYSQENNEMHNIFFGGISQYYDSAGIMVQNSDVPFVKTIANVVIDKSGKLSEYKLPVEMPFLSGAGAEFIPLPSISRYANNVIKMDAINADTILLGHIYGGILSTAPNIFWTNTGKESFANNQLIKVFLINNTPTPVGDLNSQSTNGLQMQLYLTPDRKNLAIQFYVSHKTALEIMIRDKNGKKITNEILKNITIGKNTLYKNIGTLNAGNTYWVTLKTGNIVATQKINIEP